MKCNIWRVAVRLSYILDARFLKVKCDVSKFRREVAGNCVVTQRSNPEERSSQYLRTCLNTNYAPWEISIANISLVLRFNLLHQTAE